VLDVLEKMKRQIRINGSKHSATLHYMTNYGFIPMWILVKVLSFGLINELYGILKTEDKQDICDVYGINIDEMEVYISILSNYRNLCAHEDIVYDHRTQREIQNTIYHKELNILKVDGEYIYGKRDLFALIIILKQMLSEEKFNELILLHSIKNLFILVTLDVTK
jgi:abortive infection bacteriophage resistance protein